MPIYEYTCLDCGREEEVLQRFSDDPLTICPGCGGRYQKKISAPAFQFKGDGFYETDYKRSSHSNGKTGDTAKPESASNESTGAAVSAAGTSSQPTTGSPTDGHSS